MMRFCGTLFSHLTQAHAAERLLRERRGQPRHDCQLEAHVKRSNTHFAGQVRELAGRGARLELPLQLDVGERIELSASGRAGRQRVSCEVVWCRPHEFGFLAGVRFRQPLAGSWLGYQLRVNESGPLRWERHYRRFELPAPDPAILKLDHMHEVEVLLIDLGLGGAQLRTPFKLLPGTMLRLSLRGRWPVDVVASVVGCEGGTMRLRFLRNQVAAELRLRERLTSNLKVA